MTVLSKQAAVVVSGLQIGLQSNHSHRIIDDVSFQVESGQILGLLGESGSGKTTTGLAILGYTRPGLTITDGQICVTSQDVRTMSSLQLQGFRSNSIAYVPQDPSSALNPARRIRQQMQESPTLRHRQSDRDFLIMDLLARAGIPDPAGLLDRYPHQLSGGQQQRVAIAMALIGEPKVIVFDEPTTGLDVLTQRTVLQTIRRLCVEQAVAAVYVSHDLAVVRQFADEVCVMRDGRVVESGPTANVFDVPTKPYTKSLVSSVPSLENFLSQFSRANQQDQSDTIPPPILQVAGLSVSYGARQVIRDLDLTIAAGSSLAIVGESGSGKTTLSKTIAGLHIPDTGTVSLGGERLPRSPRHRTAAQRADLQYIFQNPYSSLNPHRTIENIIAQPMRQFGNVDATDLQRRVLSVLEEVSLPASVASRYPASLSGGQRQRVAIARALVANPKLLICDEITSALDVSVQAKVLNLLEQLKRDRGLSLLFVTHNMAIVPLVANQVAVMKHGALIEIGPTEDVLCRPRDEYTSQLIDCVRAPLG